MVKEKKPLKYTRKKKFSLLANRIKDMTRAYSNKDISFFDMTKSPLYTKHTIKMANGDDKDIYLSNETFVKIVATNNSFLEYFYSLNSNTEKERELDFDKAIENITKLNNKYGVNKAIITGGEPIQYTRINDFIKELNKTCNMDYIGVEFWNKAIRYQTRFNRMMNPKDGIDQVIITFDNGINYSLDALKGMYKSTKHINVNIKFTVVVHIYEENYDNLIDLIQLLDKLTLIQMYCDEVIVTPIYLKDDYCVNNINSKELKKKILTKDTYDRLFKRLIGYYAHWYMTIRNDNVYGYYSDVLIPTPVPIILRKKRTPNYLSDEKYYVNNINCLISGDLSLTCNEQGIFHI